MYYFIPNNINLVCSWTELKCTKLDKMDIDFKVFILK